MEIIELARTSVQLITKDFQLEDSFQIEEKDPMGELKNELEKIVKHLMDHNFNQLLNALYRIDVSEEKVNAILETSPPDDVASSLAEAILERELIKAEYRLKYRP